MTSRILMHNLYYSRVSMLGSDVRVHITICGRVQGVGFRPFIYRLAYAHQLVGTIKNTCTGVFIDVQGSLHSIESFRQDIFTKKPGSALIEKMNVVPVPLTQFSSFEIAESNSQVDKSLPLLPDTAMCEECLKELFDSNNRRYQYPFLHCISCGPRFSLFLGVPFDRHTTTMAEFCMCEECNVEYRNPENRRFHSQTNCCATCGPQLQLVDAQGKELVSKEKAIETVVNYLRAGKIVAMKNTGGYLLLADATNEQAVQLLRERKRRKNKPFAIMVPDIATIEKIAHVDPLALNILTSRAAPIVLLRKKSEGEIALSVAHASPDFGIMLPHNALHYMLMKSFLKPLIATSGNVSGRPLCITEEEAFSSLASIADVFLVHNRKIKHRLDDSIVQIIAGEPVVVRKARGYIPYAIELPGKGDLFAAGSHMKNSFAFLKQDRIYMSQHIGDLDSVGACQAYESEIASWTSLLGCSTSTCVSDKHPEYFSTQYVDRLGSGVKIQHHKAHIYAGMVDCKISVPFVGIAWDGTGLGDDDSIWGGEAFLVTEKAMERVASLYPFPLPGGEKAVQEPRRSLLGLLSVFEEPIHSVAREAFTPEELSVLKVALKNKINTPLCSSTGRLFDGVSALLSLCLIADFEGQAAILLEKAACGATNTGKSYSLSLLHEHGLWLLDWRLMIQEILYDQSRGISSADIAMSFHETLAIGILHLAQAVGQERVLLSGGVMQNKLLVEKAVERLRAAGFTPYLHKDIPPNDGGIAVGQVVGWQVSGYGRSFS